MSAPKKPRMAAPPVSRVARAGWMILLAMTAWLACAVWNSIKPPPPGTHLASLPVRIGESQIDLIDDGAHPGETLAREVDAAGRAEQTIVLDQSPLPRELAQQLLARKRQRPNLAVLLVTDPRSAADGGTSAQTLEALERAGIVVSRANLERMRDPDPLYSSLWRLTVAWWSNPFDENRRPGGWASGLRRRNLKSDERRLFVADDGAGGWTSFVSSRADAPGAEGRPGAGMSLEIRGQLARDIVASETRIADWSTHDDRMPAAPPQEGRGIGTIDARYLTEGAIRASLREVLGLAGDGDSIEVIGPSLEDRDVVIAMGSAAARGAHLRILLDPVRPGTRAAAGELRRDDAAHVEIRWQTGAAAAARYALIRHRSDVWLVLGSADFGSDALGDMNLESDVELHLPARAAPARMAEDVFARNWARAAPYPDHADESRETYWRYRLAQATGSALF